MKDPIDLTNRATQTAPLIQSWKLYPPLAVICYLYIDGLTALPFQLVLILALALPLLPALVYQIWLSQPASAHRALKYIQETHRQKVGLLTEKEALAKYAVTAAVPGALPLASLSHNRDQRFERVIGMVEAQRHGLVVAPTRSGKGLLATQQLLTYPHAMVVIDPKGELYERTAGYRERFGPVYHVPDVTIDLADYYDLDKMDDVIELHYHLMQMGDSRRHHNPAFGEKCLNLFIAANSYAKAYGLNPLRVLIQAADADPQAVLTAWATVNEAAVMAFTNGTPIANLSQDRFATSSWGQFDNSFKYYIQHIDTITTQSMNSIPQDWLTRRATIYITYSFDQLKSVCGVVSALIAALMKHQITHQLPGQATILIDELARVGLRNLGDYMATVGGYGISLVSFIQDYPQLIELYGKLGAANVEANAAYQVWYPPNDEETAERMSKLGRTEVGVRRSTSRQRTGQAIRPEALTSSLDVRPVLSPSEIRAMQRDEVLVLLDGGHLVQGYRLWPVAKFEQLPKPSYRFKVNRPTRAHWLADVPTARPTDLELGRKHRQGYQKGHGSK